MLASISAYMAALTGVGNIAVEGIMLMSCLMAVLGSYWTQSAVLGLLIALLSVCAASVPIMRMKPNEILSKMS